jgi:hypothetical protein
MTQTSQHGDGPIRLTRSNTDRWST